MEREFPGNAHGARRQPAEEEPKKVERVVQSGVRRRKKSLGKRMSETFVGGDARGAGSYVFFDVLLPAFKDMVADAVTMGVEKMVFGEARPGGRRGIRPGPTSYTPYNRYGAPTPGARPDPRTPLSRRARATHNFDEIILETRHEAQEVLDRLFDQINQYESVTVATLYDMLNVDSSFTDQKYGWVDIRDAEVRRIRDGYLLDLPRPEPLD